MWIDTIANVCCSRQLPDDKADLLGRMGQFRGRIESLAPDSRWVPMLYTITAEGNEKGSNAVIVERPG